MLFYTFFFILFIYTNIAYTLNVNDYSDKLYYDITKNLSRKPMDFSERHVEILNPKYVKRVELVLSQKYGDKEVEYFRNMLKEYKERELKGESSYHLFDYYLKNHVNQHFDDNYARDFNKLDDPNEISDDLITARIVLKLIKHEFEKFNQLKEKYITPNMERFTQIRTLSHELPIPSSTDTPCNTQAGCDKLEILMNLCSYIRGGVSLVYDIFATMVHVLGNMLSVLCGCIFVGPAQVCLLKNFPYTCRIPYPAFSQLFQSTYSVWELVKISTNLCRVYGGILCLFVFLDSFILFIFLNLHSFTFLLFSIIFIFIIIICRHWFWF